MSQRWYFNPRSPRGERQPSSVQRRENRAFQPSLPARGATPHLNKFLQPVEISTLAPREGSDFVAVHFEGQRVISTLAPREGSDPMPFVAASTSVNFNPRSPRGERPRCRRGVGTLRAFQPSLPARGATTLPPWRRDTEGISTLAPREGSDYVLMCGAAGSIISTLAPREGSDDRSHNGAAARRHFNPRSPRGERLVSVCSSESLSGISTLAPREGSDRSPRCRPRGASNFNPRSPRGERR